MHTQETDRLILRQWRDSDRQPFFALNSDPEVMRYFPSTLSREQSDSALEKTKATIATNGWGFWACELKQSGELIGFVGLNQPDDSLPFTPCIEIGWRLARKHWNKGYATEAAKKCLAFGFEELGLDEIVAFAVKSNQPSIAVMTRIGMNNTFRNFNHPEVNVKHLKEHVLFKIKHTQMRANRP